MDIFNIGPRAILASLWWRALLEMLPADWMRASRDAHCLVMFSIKFARMPKRIRRHDRDLQTVFGIKLTPLTGLNRTQIKQWYIVRSSGNIDKSVILFGRHAGIWYLLQCLKRLSQPIAWQPPSALQSGRYTSVAPSKITLLHNWWQWYYARALHQSVMHDSLAFRTYMFWLNIHAKQTVSNNQIDADKQNMWISFIG